MCFVKGTKTIYIIRHSQVAPLPAKSSIGDDDDDDDEFPRFYRKSVKT